MEGMSFLSREQLFRFWRHILHQNPQIHYDGEFELKHLIKNDFCDIVAKYVLQT